MQESPRFFKAWILYTLTCAIAILAVGAVVGLVVGVILGAAGCTDKTLDFVSHILGIVLGLSISFYTFRWAVSEVLFSQPAASQQGDDAGEKESRKEHISADDAKEKSWGGSDPWGDDPGR